MKSLIAMLGGFATGMLLAIYSPKFRNDVASMTDKMLKKMDDYKNEMMSAMMNSQNEEMTTEKNKNKQNNQNNKKEYKNS